MKNRAWPAILFAILSGIEPQQLVAADGPTLASARSHLNRGRYEEAIEEYTVLAQAKTELSVVAVQLSRAHEAIGGNAKAIAVVESALKSTPEDALLQARLAELLYRTGKFDDARRIVDKALQLDANQPLARLVHAELCMSTGRLDEANEGFRWFIRFYNQAQPEDADTLLLVARGAIRYARWNRNTQIYNFAVNTLCPDALKKDPECWLAHEFSGLLLLEKYNREQALPEFHRALAINARAVEAYVDLGTAALDEQELDLVTRQADKALGINPACIDALLLKADVAILRGNLPEARTISEKALAINPLRERTLARLAACCLLEDGFPNQDELRKFLDKPVRSDVAVSQTRFASIIIDLMQRNPHPGRFYCDLGELVEGRRQLQAAEAFYTTAVNVMPQHPEPKNLLGLLSMRTGKTDEARKILDDAFLSDPYHVRISNMRKVIRLLDGYEVITTDHFVIRVDSKLDQTLGRYMAEYLEDVYKELTAEYGFEPPQRTQFEIFNQSQGLSAHEWFSARMVGLPWLHTIGASTGMMVAMASPTAAKEPFNWARVLKHEFVHVITLQQTQFNIPHWFTEALAVTAEKSPRSEQWDRLLLERVPQGRIRNLDNLDEGFQRPESPDDWQFAYCQSRLYAQLMIEKYGTESIRKMLEAYRDNLPTAKAIERALGVSKEQFEKEYREFLEKTVAELRSGELQPVKPLDVAERAYRDDMSSTPVAADYAAALLHAGQKDVARKIAKETLEKNSREGMAAMVLARLEMAAGNSQEAARILEQALDRENPRRDVLLFLAQFELRRERFTEAVALFELGCNRFPANRKGFLKGLATAAEGLNDAQRAVRALEKLADLEPDDSAPRKKLAAFALAASNWQVAAEYGRQALFVDVLDADVHRMLGEAWTGLGMWPRAILEFETALQLKPGDDNLQLAAARANLSAGERMDAKAHLEAILKRSSDHAEARELLKSIP